MKIEYTARGFTITPAIRKLAKGRLARVERQLPSAMDAHVIFSAEKNRRIAEIVLRGKGKTFKAAEESGDMYLSLGAAADTLERIVRKYVDRKIGRRRLGKRDKFRLAVLEVAAAEAAGSQQEAAAPPRIVRTRRYAAKPLSVEDAVMELDRVRNNFIVFRNAESGRYNVLYRRDDGHLGYLDLED